MTTAKKSCGCVCSLRIRTLIMLWIVMIGCGFHIWGVSLNHDHSVMPDNQELIKVEDDTTNDRSHSGEIIREKRSTADSDAGTRVIIQEEPITWFDLISKPIEKIHGTIHDGLTEVKNLANRTVQTGISAVKSIPQRVRNTTEKVRSGIQGATDQVRGLTDGSIIQKTVQTVGEGITAIKSIPANVAESVMNISGAGGSIHNIENRIGERVADDFADAFIERFDKRLNESELRIQRLVKNYIHYYFFIWSVIGVISSVLGIFGIHENVSRCLTLSVFFFYFSAFSFIVIILELNIDSDTELRKFVLFEVTGVMWKNFEDSMMFINIGALLITVLSLHFMHIVKKCRSAISKKNSDAKADTSNDEVYDHNANSMNNIANNARSSEVQAPLDDSEV
ncbi:uncharacterized protein LOC135834986 [Planococcus citri]|uniref:uncharacterized protein LOC135834986 n=1 Tax=Planococcus citri TaxID=170843 RepID=UPI0031F778FC